MSTALAAQIERQAPIPTWFGVGGGADALARPGSASELRELVARRDVVRVLGDGANLLVEDGGVDGLVVSLSKFAEVVDLGGRRLRVGAGVNLPKLILDCCRRGLSGLETLGGVPASVGGALVMNAGGSFGQISDVVDRVFAVSREGEETALEGAEIAFGYRRSGLNGLIVTGAEIALGEGVPEQLRARLKEIMAFKSASQPMGDHCAGCVFKNPTVSGARVSAGKLIDESGCKGWTEGGARVSDVHANFITAAKGGSAGEVLALIERVRERVRAERGVELETEVAVWRRGDGGMWGAGR